MFTWIFLLRISKRVFLGVSGKFSASRYKFLFNALFFLLLHTVRLLLFWIFSRLQKSWGVCSREYYSSTKWSTPLRGARVLWLSTLFSLRIAILETTQKHIMLLWALMLTENEVKLCHSLYLLNNSLAGWSLPAHKLFTKLQIKWHKSVLLPPYRKENMANFSQHSPFLMNKSISFHVFLKRGLSKLSY